MNLNVKVILRPFCVVCGALGLGAGPCWRPRPSPAGPGPRSNAASAAEGSHSGHAGGVAEREIKNGVRGPPENLSVFVETHGASVDVQLVLFGWAQPLRMKAWKPELISPERISDY